MRKRSKNFCGTDNGRDYRLVKLCLPAVIMMQWVKKSKIRAREQKQIEFVPLFICRTGRGDKKKKKKATPLSIFISYTKLHKNICNPYTPLYYKTSHPLYQPIANSIRLTLCNPQLQRRCEGLPGHRDNYISLLRITCSLCMVSYS